MKNPFRGQDILTVEQFTLQNLSFLFAVTDKMKKIVQEGQPSRLLAGKIMTALFYEPSSRTFGSFIATMQRLGGSIIPIQGVTYSSVAKGESLPDTIRTFSCYSDCIVLRHPEVGSAQAAAHACEIPVINAGDGTGEHPTQALLDLYTIKQHCRNIRNCTIGMVGDLKNGRTVHSLAKLLCLFGPNFIFVSPPQLKMPKEIMEKVERKSKSVLQTQSLEKVIDKMDVCYDTRIQKERFNDQKLYERVKNTYIITLQLMKQAKEKMILMHPLPRVNEISTEVDSDPRAVYLGEQMRNGLYVRMALLAAVLGKI